MTAIDIHRKLQNLCKLGVVRKEYIDINVLLAIVQIPEQEMRSYLDVLCELDFITLRKDIISMTENGLIANI